MARGLILASASPQRKKLLKSLRVPFRIIPADIPEDSAQKRPQRLTVQLALRKARAIAARHPKALVLGADTVVVCRGVILGKPRDRKESSDILQALNGRWHRVYTGVALIDGATKKVWRAVVTSRVKARRLRPEDLQRFVGRHMDKAGAYAVQDHGDPFIERIEGPVDNVIGLPMTCVRDLLRRACRSRAKPTEGR
ncbi:MAG: septum formation protein Maf [Elusimicrobia bacterium GWA2_69_24]|nr:MAG: septum formation protein Maf [Elusimicrobia bacterium GWA2_69_24]